MGGSSWDSKAWSSYSSATRSKPADKIFTKKAVGLDMKPFNVKMRECRDSDANPAATPIYIGLDVTGSMGHISEYMAKDGLGTLVENVLSRKPVTDPAIMFAACADADYDHDRSLQIGQFESDITMTKWLESMVHGGGGNNDIESYDLHYYFAAHHTATDAWEKRQKKGYIFTIGDECAPLKVKASHLKQILNVDVQSDILFSDLMGLVRQTWIPYHIVVAQGSFARSNLDRVEKSWEMVMGQNVLILSDYTKIAELIVSVLEVENGVDTAATAASWSDSTAVVVRDAISHLPSTHKDGGTGVVRF